MNLKTLQEKTNNLLIFNKNLLRKLEPQKDALDGNIKYWLKNRKIIALKKSLYILTETFEKEPNKNFFIEYIANQLVKPSYLPFGNQSFISSFCKNYKKTNEKIFTLKASIALCLNVLLTSSSLA